MRPTGAAGEGAPVTGDVARLLGGYEFAAKALLALIPLFGVFGGAVASWLVAGRGVYVNSITAERSKWLDKLRESISNFQAAVSTYAFRHNLPVIREQVADQAKLFEEIERTTRLASAIQLQLNPAGEIDGAILTLVRAMSVARHGSFQKLAKIDDLLTLHAQWLLKAEWEKVKWEAGGLLHRARHLFDAARRRSRYRAFSRGDGAVRPHVAALGESVGLDWR